MVRGYYKKNGVQIKFSSRKLREYKGHYFASKWRDIKGHYRVMRLLWRFDNVHRYFPANTKVDSQKNFKEMWADAVGKKFTLQDLKEARKAMKVACVPVNVKRGTGSAYFKDKETIWPSIEPPNIHFNCRCGTGY